MTVLLWILAISASIASLIIVVLMVASWAVNQAAQLEAIESEEEAF
jgi:hypothetical protein